MKSVNTTVYKYLFCDIDEDGWKFISIMAVFTVLAALLWFPLGGLFFVLDIWCYYSFRDPHRIVPVLSGAVIAPIDGIVVSINKEKGPDCVGMQNKNFNKIRIYSNPFNVHICRMPIKAKVSRMFYDSGKTFSGTFNVDNICNERLVSVFRHSDGYDFVLQQTTVFCSKRIVSKLKNNGEYRAGERIGLLRMGGYIDIFIPEKISPRVCVGQIMISGETMMADIKSDAPRLEGEII